MKKPEITVRNIGYFSLDGFQGRDPLPTLTRAVSYLRNLELKFHVSAGTALGIHRDKGFIPHDTDLDLAVVLPWKKDHYELVAKLVKKFAGANMPVVRMLLVGQKPIQLIFSDLLHEGTLVDLEFYYTGIIKHRWVHYKPEGYISLPSYYGIKDVEFPNGTIQTVPLPDPIEDYLTKRYGDWQTPTKEKGAWQTYTKALHLWES